MSQEIQEQLVDVCVLGLGRRRRDIVAAELSLAGYKVVGIEKGPYWDYANDFAPLKYDEWGVLYLRKFDHPLRMFTYTIRNDSQQMALPVRRNIGNQIITPGHGVGGMAQHYGGMMGRFGPWVYQMQSETASRYGAGFLDSIAPTNDVEDWPMTYEEYDPYYVEFEKAFGVTGTNQGPFQPMSQNFPMPPHPLTAVGSSRSSGMRGARIPPVPHADLARLRGLRQPVPGTGQPVRLRRLVRRDVQLCLRGGRQGQLRLQDHPRRDEDGQLLDGPEQLRLQARHGPWHGNGRPRPSTTTPRATSTSSLPRSSTTGCGASTSSGFCCSPGWGRPTTRRTSRVRSGRGPQFGVPPPSRARA